MCDEIANNQNCLDPRIIHAFIELGLKKGLFPYPGSGVNEALQAPSVSTRAVKSAIKYPSKYRLPKKFEHMLKNGRRYCSSCVRAAILSN